MRFNIIEQVRLLFLGNQGIIKKAAKGGRRRFWMNKGTEAVLGRPVMYTDDTKVYLCATGKAKLQAGSDRRAIVNVLVENSGCMTMAEIDKHFGFCIRDKVFALQKAGWVRIERNA